MNDDEVYDAVTAILMLVIICLTLITLARIIFG